MPTTRFDVAWDPISFAYGQPSVTAFLNVFGLTGLVTEESQKAILALNNYIQNDVKPQLADVCVASPFPNMDVIKSGMATGAIAHYETELIKGSRGGVCEQIPIHSVRLPGYIASQEVILGGLGQTLKFRHDTISRESFMPGVVLAIKEVTKTKGLTYGLENFL